MAKKSKYHQRPDGLFEAIRTINGKRVAFRGKSCREVDRKILCREASERGIPRTCEGDTAPGYPAVYLRVREAGEERQQRFY